MISGGKFFEALGELDVSGEHAEQKRRRAMNGKVRRKKALLDKGIIP
jgi:hypothetical protein